MHASQPYWAALQAFGGGIIAAAAMVASPLASAAQCVGDCNADGTVTVSELIVGVNIALGLQPPSACPAFQGRQGDVTIAQLVLGVNTVLNGCPAAATATHTGVPTETVTAMEPPATRTPPTMATGMPTATASAIATPTSTPALTPTRTPEPTESSTPAAIGEAAAGQIAIVAAGLGGVPSIIAALVAQITNEGPSLSEVVVPNALPRGVLDVQGCALSGTTAQLCTEMGESPEQSIHLELGADACTAAGPAGGRVTFDGGIIVDSDVGNVPSCSPIRFHTALYRTEALRVERRSPAMQPQLTVTANVSGYITLGLTFQAPPCLATAFDLTLTGTVSSALADRRSVQVELDHTAMRMDQITFNDQCVPVAYRLTFNGAATFSVLGEEDAMTAGLQAAPSFDVSFSDLHLVQDTSSSPTTMEIDGSMSSRCGGALDVGTTLPIAAAAGELCPRGGSVTAAEDGGTAVVMYHADHTVTVQHEDEERAYPHCLAIELLRCS